MTLPAEGFLIEYAPGRLLVGEGPLEARPERTPDRPACYAPDFFLRDPGPWLHPASWRETTRADLRSGLGTPPVPGVRWQAPDAAAYHVAFADVMARIADGTLTKAVPIVMETGRWTGDPSGVAPGLLHAILQAPGPNLVYAVWWREGGMVGASPEILFTRDGNRVETVAVAGTYPAARADALPHDAKELREHQNVVDDIAQALAPFGAVTVGPRTLLPLPGLVHLKTDLRVTLAAPTPFTTLVHALHPTAALGVFPRSAGLDLLQETGPHRRRRFGAPFGVEWPDGRATVLVAIRNVQWEGAAVLLAAGAGLVAGSRRESEWAELALKRATVKGMLGL